MAIYLISKGDVQTQTILESTVFVGTEAEAKTEAMNSVGSLPEGQEMIVSEAIGYASESTSSVWTDL